MRLGALVLLAACSAPAPTEPSWCIDGATSAEAALIESAVSEWNERAGAGIVVGADCDRRLVVVDELTRMGEWDGYEARVARPRTGVAEADAAVLRWVALHELGHALGLGHSDHEEDVMFSSSTFQEHLTQRDVDALWELRDKVKR